MAGTAKSVLIADDDRLVRRTFQHCLESRGYTVKLAEDGRAALSLVAAQAFDIFLLDIFMPEKEGLETLLEAKQLRPTQRIVVMSGGALHGSLDWLALAKRFGADGVLKKPATLDELFAAIDRVTASP